MNLLEVFTTSSNTSLDTRRNNILGLEKTIKELEIPDSHKVDLPVKEYFCNGLYARELEIPKGIVLVGEIHKYPQINVLAKGSIVVATEDGERTITAPATFVSKAGIKRAGYTLEDTVWIEFHATSTTDSEKLRAEMIVQDYETLDKLLENNNVLGSSSSRITGRNNPVPRTTSKNSS